MGAWTIARRTFFLGSATIAGGVAFGVYAARQPFDNPLEGLVAEGEATFNPWVVISNEKITLIAPHADKGQGVSSMQATLIAEELDVELDQVEISFGAPDKAYYNHALAEPMAGFMSTDESGQAEFARGLVGGIVKLALPLQITGGSTSSPDSWVKLRQAGAVARETLKLAASKRSGVAVVDLVTRAGAVILPDGKTLGYTQLAEDAGQLRPVSDVELRDSSQWRMIGKPIVRTDMQAKIDGSLQYSIDMTMPGMVHATVKVNPRQGGAMLGFDASQAETMPGIDRVLEITNGVAVIANNTWRAFRAADAITFDWGDAPYPHAQEDHWKTLETALGNQEALNAIARDEGAVDASLDAGEVFEASYRSPYVAHAPLEPLSATILVTDNRVDVWTGHQLPGQAEQFVADITGVAIENVHLHNMFMGGSFGHRLEFEWVRQAAEIGTQMRGTPIKLTYSREEDFLHDFPRHITIGRGRGVVENGQVQALDVEIAGQSVSRSQAGRMNLNVPGPDAQLHEGAWDNPYFNLPNLRVRSYATDALAPVSSWRAVGAGPNGFIFDSFLDEMIHQAGADPLAERIRLMGHSESVKVLEAVGEMSDWSAPTRPGFGKGVAFVNSFGVPTAEVVEVEMTDRGIRIHNVWIAVDVGQVIDPVNFENLVQGGVVFGLGHAINCEITYRDGMAEQTNYHAHEGMRLYQCPNIYVRGLENQSKVRGIGEPPVPPAAPALANAIFAATGLRIRELPLNKHIDFV